MKTFSRLLVLVALLSCAGCEPEVGSDAWCEAMTEKPRGDWSMNEAGEFAKNCVIKTYDDDK